MSSYGEALRALNTAQRQAVETIDGPVLVIAGPGTGKTQLLTTRIAHILAKTDTLPQNILCLTFTDSAAQTMRERLSGLIGKSAYDVTISTYHAFGKDLIGRYPDYFASDANLQPADDLTADRILRDIIAGLPYSNPLKYADVYLRDIKTLISDSKKALLAPSHLRSVAKDNLAFITQANPIVRQTLSGMALFRAKDIPLFATLYEKIAASDLHDPKSLASQFAETLSAATEEAQATNKTSPLTIWKKDWLAKDANGEYVVGGEKVNQKLVAAADIYQKYIDELKTRQLYDYDDMILRSIRALETNADLRYTLQEQYQYMLLDEFQDTNGAQLRIVELLTDSPVNEGRPNVLAVGDDDQAIYAFQGANYSHMLHFAHTYKDVVVISLTENYRSHANILHTARGIAEQIKERLHHNFPGIGKNLAAKAKVSESTVERRRAASDVMQYAWVAKCIAAELAKGTKASEIAVLAPKHKYLQPLVPFLQQAGVPVRYEKRENVLDEPGIVELIRMAELTLALKNGDLHSANALWAQVLSFDFWQLPTSRIWQLSWQASDDRRSWTDELLDDEQLAPIALFFIRLGLLSGSETLETIMDYLIGSAPLDLKDSNRPAFTSPYYQHYFGAITGSKRADFWSLLNSLIVLRARLREHHKPGAERLYIADFIGFVRAHQAAELQILNTSPYASGTEAVQLMTAYKAKGMEFAAVFALSVNDESWGGKSRSSGNRISLPQNLKFIRYKGSDDDERLRLLYVAITRAKSQLYLVDYAQDYAGKAMTLLKYLDETTDENGALHSPLLPPHSQTVLPAEETAPEPTTELAAYWQTRHTGSINTQQLRALLDDRLQRYQLSPTDLGSFVDIANCGPHDFFLRSILRFPQTMRPEVHFGNAMHETLEWLHLAAKKEGLIPTPAAAKKALNERLKTKPLSAEQQEQLLEKGKAMLVVYLAQRAHTISPANTTEHNFKNEGVFVGKAHLSGKIDKLIIDKQTKEITIVDYKTGRNHSRWAREISLHKYRQQLYFYKALVEGSHTFAGYKVVDAYLEFVEPDDSARIQELHLEFDETEYRRTKQLAETVWHRITTLDLPDITGYDKNLKGIEQFELALITEEAS